MTREEKKQKKLEEKEAARLAKIEKKNNHFYKKLKAKIDQLFKSIKLTFCGKLFILSLYTSVISSISICVISCVRSVFDTLLALAKISTTELNLFKEALAICLALFSISIFCVIGLALVEAISLACSEPSILEKEDEE